MKKFICLFIAAAACSYGEFERNDVNAYFSSNEKVVALLAAEERELADMASAILAVSRVSEDDFERIHDETIEALSIIQNNAPYYSSDQGRRDLLNAIQNNSVPSLVRGYLNLIAYINESDDKYLLSAINEYPQIISIVIELYNMDLKWAIEYLIFLDAKYASETITGSNDYRRAIATNFEEISVLILEGSEIDLNKYSKFLGANASRYLKGPAYFPGPAKIEDLLSNPVLARESDFIELVKTSYSSDSLMDESDVSDFLDVVSKRWMSETGLD